MLKTPKITSVNFLCLLATLTLGMMLSSLDADATEASFTTLVLPTTVDPDMDIWYRIPPNSGPYVPSVNEVFKGQAFSLQILFNNYEVSSSGKVNLTYDVQVYDPQGLPTEDKGSGLVGYTSETHASPVLLLNQQYMIIVFTDSYVLGTYTIEVSAYDNVSGNKYVSRTPIALVPFEPQGNFEEQDKVAEWMMNYYYSPSPENAIDAAVYWLETDEEWIYKNLHILKFFTQVFEDNPFLMDYLKNNLVQYTKQEQKRLLLLEAMLGQTALLEQIDDEQHLAFRTWASELSFPPLDGNIDHPMKLDLLWSEFFATGTYTPIAKIISALSLSKYEGSIERLSADEIELTQKSQQDAYLDAIYQSAIWSLYSNSQKHPLVFKYAAFVYQYEELSDDVKRPLYNILRSVQETAKKSEKQSEK
jgi:hypothetical protein